MTFSEFSTMYSSMYRIARNRDPFAISIRRAFNRYRHLDSVMIAAAVTEELA